MFFSSFFMGIKHIIWIPSVFHNPHIFPAIRPLSPTRPVRILGIFVRREPCQITEIERMDAAPAATIIYQEDCDGVMQRPSGDLVFAIVL
jgi:hypothetical protein